MSENTDDPRLLAAAAAVADGTPVNWAELTDASTVEESPVLHELRAINRLNTARDAAPLEWGPFIIVGQVGRGMFGRVYHAIDPNLRRDVALKVIAGRGAHVDLDAALEEGRRLARIRHPNVVHVYRADRLGDEVGIAMELVRGRTLGDVVAQDGPLGPQEAALIGMDLCRALAAIHASGTLHGDIKARNVMREPRGRTVLMDLGAGRDLAVEPGVGEDFAGTPAYLAPEVFAGQPRTKASDIYSLGVLLYHLVSGSYPVEGLTTTSIGRQHRKGAANRPLRDRCPELPDALVRAVERALAARPEDRFESAGAFETALAAVVVPRPVAAGASSRRISAIVAITILAIAGVAIGYRTAFPTVEPGGATTAAAPAAAPADAYRIEAAFYVERNGADVRLPRGARVSPGDRLSLQIEASVPVYLYVVNEDEQGESYLLFPLPGQGVSNPLAGALRHRLPGEGTGQRLSWQVTSAGGREHFLVFASPERSPTFDQMFASLPAPAVDTPVQSARLSPEALGVLRGVGGLAPTPAQPGAQLRLARDFATPLADGQETVRGTWIRQVTLENPAQ